jgi:tetratricopeptide (TPR) repeat protein
MVHLVLALTPMRIEDHAAWPSFLQSLINAPLPPTLRVMVVDMVDRPMLDALATAEPVRVQTVCPDLDMAGALEEIADNATGVGPGNDFRKLFVRLGNAASRGEVGAAHRLAVAALRITRKHRWPDLQVPVFMVLGALHLRLGNHDKALLAYRRAGGSAEAAKAAGNPGGGKLVVQTGFAEAAALLAAERHPEAAKLYESLVPLAKEEAELFLELEAWRMASYCHELTDTPREAWRCGLAALDAAAALDPELRRNSTVPFLGQRLIDLVERYHGDAKHVRNLRNRLEALIGADWEQTLAATAGKDAAA